MKFNNRINLHSDSDAQKSIYKSEVFNLTKRRLRVQSVHKELSIARTNILEGARIRQCVIMMS